MAIEFGTENPIKEKTLQSVINCQALDKTFFLLAGRSSSRASLNAPYWCDGDEISLLLLAVRITSGLDRDADSHSIAGHRLGLSHFPEVKPTSLHLPSNFPLWRRVRAVNMTSLCPVPGFLLQVVACRGGPSFSVLSVLVSAGLYGQTQAKSCFGGLTGRPDEVVSTQYLSGDPLLLHFCVSKIPFLNCHLDAAFDILGQMILVLGSS